MNNEKTLKILGLSTKEEKVLVALSEGLDTPLLVSRSTKVTRAAVYEVLKKLKNRGLINSNTKDGKKYWHLLSQKDMSNTLYEAKKTLLGFSDGREEYDGVTDGVVVVHRGIDAIKTIIFEMIKNRKNERFLALTPFSDILDKGWLSIFTPDEINEFNRIVKRNAVISELVAPEHWIEDHYKAMGDTWAKDYEGRSSSAVYLSTKYFNHSAQIFAFKDSMYLLALNDKMIIEIRHSDIQKMILAMYSFMKDRGEVVDVNKRLRDLMEKN